MRLRRGALGRGGIGARASCSSRRAAGALLATVLELVEAIEGEFAAMLKPGEFARVRAGLLLIADRIDPDGRLGARDRSG